MSNLSFAQLRIQNAKRVVRWHPEDGPPENKWTGSDWGNAAAGEMGEACNVIKKLRRHETGYPGKRDPNPEMLRGELAKEIGDVIVYLDLIARHYGLDLEDCVKYAFNQVSEREGFPERL